MTSTRLFIMTMALACCSVSATELHNTTCAAAHECEAKGSIMTVMPVYSSASSMLDEALVGRPRRFLDSPSMRAAEFPNFSSSNDDLHLSSLTSTTSVEGFLTTDSQADLGMF
mmetsp:Transcript_30921/g.64843  ORF Transcript_30921/g.64843 Transcript_30921/m.64843 type:complete len:113 (-) Transcript_30921:149-487(-)